MGRVTLSCVVALALLGACSDDESVANAEPGECIEDLDALFGIVESLPEVPCDEDHDAEVIHVFEHEGDDDDYPGQTELEQEASAACQGEIFEDFVGVPYGETAIEVGVLPPTEASWGNGDRETICIGFVRAQSVDQSFEDSGEDFPSQFDELVGACEGGDNAACDELYRTTPIGSPEEEIGSTCAGRSPTPVFGNCQATLG